MLPSETIEAESIGPVEKEGEERRSWLKNQSQGGEQRKSVLNIEHKSQAWRQWKREDAAQKDSGVKKKIFMPLNSMTTEHIFICVFPVCFGKLCCLK